MKKIALILAALVAAFSFSGHADAPAKTYCSADSGVTWLPCNPAGGGSIPAGTNIIGKVGIDQTTPGTTNGVTPVPATTNGLTLYTGSLTNTAVAVDASAGQVYGYYFYNSNATVCYIQFFNTAQGSVTVGTTAPVLSLGIPAGGGANVTMPIGLTFSTAITIAATTTRANGTACGSNIDANVFYK